MINTLSPHVKEFQRRFGSEGLVTIREMGEEVTSYGLKIHYVSGEFVVSSEQSQLRPIQVQLIFLRVVPREWKPKCLSADDGKVRVELIGGDGDRTGICGRRVLDKPRSPGVPCSVL